jgi:hypothetical protein
MPLCRAVASVVHCQALLYILGSFFSLGLSATALLFFYRVRAVYGNGKIITAFFGFTWVGDDGEENSQSNKQPMTASR